MRLKHAFGVLDLISPPDGFLSESGKLNILSENYQNLVTRSSIRTQLLNNVQANLYILGKLGKIVVETFQIVLCSVNFFLVFPTSDIAAETKLYLSERSENVLPASSETVTMLTSLYWTYSFFFSWRGKIEIRRLKNIWVNIKPVLNFAWLLNW